jgi:biopolymer transport protein ExbD
VVILVGADAVLVQGELVIATPDLIKSGDETIQAIADRLERLESNIIGVSTRAVVESKEVTILADKAIPFSVLKKIMSTCTGVGYGRISLAVIQKSPQT